MGLYTVAAQSSISAVPSMAVSCSRSKAAVRCALASPATPLQTATAYCPNASAPGTDSFPPTIATETSSELTELSSIPWLAVQYAQLFSSEVLVASSSICAREIDRPPLEVGSRSWMYIEVTFRMKTMWSDGAALKHFMMLGKYVGFFVGTGMSVGLVA